MKIKTRSIRLGRLIMLGMSCIFLVVSPCMGQLPGSCKPPSELASALRSKPAAEVYDAAGAWFAQNRNLTCAVAAFDNAVRLKPASAEAHYNLGVAYEALKRSTDAEKQVRLALKYDPGLKQAHTSLGMLLLDTDRAVEAEAEFREVVKEEGDTAPALDHVGLALASQRRYSAAIQYWQQALAIQPDSPEIVLSLAAATYKVGDKKAAIAMLAALVKEHPDMKDAHFTLANIYSQETRFGEAATEYGEVTRLDPADDLALLSEAKALSSSGGYEEAVAPGEEYVRRNPRDAEGHVVLGYIYKTLALYDKAEAELTTAAAARPQDPKAQYELGFVLAKNQKNQDALLHLEKSYSLDPSDTATQFQLAGVLRKLGDTKRAAEVTEAFKTNKEKERQISQLTVTGGQANSYLQSGDPARAAEVYRQMLALDPGNARTEYNLALALAAMHDLRGEREALEKAVEFDPRMAVAQSELGVMDIAAGNVPSARKRLETAIALDPQLAAVQGNLGLVYALSGDSATAEQMFRKAIEDDPKYVQGHLNLGLTLASRQDFAGAETQLEQALSLAPGDPRVVSALGKVKARLGKGDEATALLRKGVELTPRSEEAHLDLAIALADGYDLQGALAEADNALQLSPQSESAQFNRGRILFDLGRPAEAKASLEKTLDLAPKAAEPRYYLALVEKQLGDCQSAASQLQAVVAAQPGNAMAWNFLGQCLHTLAKDQEAISAWRRALAIDPQYTPALYGLSRALLPIDQAESERVAAQLKEVLKQRHILDEAEVTANNAIASMQAHDWPEAVKGLKEAIGICGDCSEKAALHKSLGLIYCHSGDLDNGEKELRLSDSLKSGDPDVERALSLIGRARGQRGALGRSLDDGRFALARTLSRLAA